jgi:hypothetical protein
MPALIVGQASFRGFKPRNDPAPILPVTHKPMNKDPFSPINWTIELVIEVVQVCHIEPILRPLKGYFKFEFWNEGE